MQILLHYAYNVVYFLLYSNDSVDTSKRKKDQFLTENGFKLISSHFQDSNDITVEKWMKD